MKSQASVVMNRLSEMSEQAKNLMSKEHEFFIKKDDWRGLGYILNGQRVVSSMNEVREIIENSSKLFTSSAKIIYKVYSADRIMLGINENNISCFFDNPNLVSTILISINSRSLVILWLLSFLNTCDYL